MATCLAGRYDQRCIQANGDHHRRADQDASSCNRHGGEQRSDWCDDHYCRGWLCNSTDRYDRCGKRYIRCGNSPSDWSGWRGDRLYRSAVRYPLHGGTDGECHSGSGYRCTVILENGL